MKREFLVAISIGACACTGASSADDPDEVLDSIEDQAADTAISDSSEADVHAEVEGPPDVSIDTAETEIIENRDIYNPETDSLEWPYTLAFAEECWRYTPTIEGEDITINGASWLTVDGDTIYYQTASLQQDKARSFLHAITADGSPLWHVETWEMMIPIPPIIDGDGNILLVAQSIQIPHRTANGVRVQKWSKDGVKLWERLGDAVFEDLVYTYDRQLGSRAAAIDDQNNLYFVTGAFLRSVDSATGDPRWHYNMVPDHELRTGGDIASPTIVDNQIYMVNDSYDLIVLDTDGELVLKRKGLFANMHTRWLSASRAGFLFSSASAYGLVTFTLDGEILGFDELNFGDASYFNIGSDDAGIIYAKHLYGGMRAVMPDLSPVWTSPDFVAAPDTGLIIDTLGHVGYKNFFDLTFQVLDRATGELIFDEHPLAVTYGQPVIVHDGEAIMVARYPGVDRPHLKCIKVPLGVPNRDAWSTGHANFKNQRRIHTFAWDEPAAAAPR